MSSVPPVALPVERRPLCTVAATVGGEKAVPAVLRNRYGAGEAILLTAGEGALRDNESLCSLLARLAVGWPALRCDQAPRYRIILTRVGAAHVLHVIDRTGGSPGWEPGEVTVSLLAERLGNPKRAVVVPGDSPVKTHRWTGWIMT